jgi:hypothetical protein
MMPGLFSFHENPYQPDREIKKHYKRLSSSHCNREYCKLQGHAPATDKSEFLNELTKL